MGRLTCALVVLAVVGAACDDDYGNEGFTLDSECVRDLVGIKETLPLGATCYNNGLAGGCGEGALEGNCAPGLVCGHEVCQRPSGCKTASDCSFTGGPYTCESYVVTFAISGPHDFGNFCDKGAACTAGTFCDEVLCCRYDCVERAARAARLARNGDGSARVERLRAASEVPGFVA